MKTLNNQLAEVHQSKIRQFDAYCSQYKDVIKLTLGQPLFPTPSPIKAKAKEAIDKNITFYTPNIGLSEAIENTLQYCKEQLNLNYGKDEIFMTVGSTEALSVTLRTLLNDGDEVLIPAPVYPGYEPLVKLYNAKVVEVDTAADGFELTPETLEKYITPKTKCIIVTDPNNPTGVSMKIENRNRLVEYLVKTGIYVIADEVYNRIVYSEGYRSLGTYPELRDQLIIVNSFSKSHSMTGWRIGFLLATAPMIKELMKAHQYYVTAACSVTQYALQAINDAQTEKEVAVMVHDYKECRDFAYDFITNLGFKCVKPEGAFYLFASVEKFGMDGDEFAKKLVDEQHVALIPGSAFSDLYKNYVRFSYCVDLDLLKKAFDKLAVFVKGL